MKIVLVVAKEKILVLNLSLISCISDLQDATVYFNVLNRRINHKIVFYGVTLIILTHRRRRVIAVGSYGVTLTILTHNTSKLTFSS